MNKSTFKSSGNSIIDIEDIKSVARVIAQNWFIIVGTVLIAYAASYLYSYKLTNVYAAQTQVIMESNDKINEQSIIGENYGSYYNWWNPNIENITAMRVIKSYDLIESAVNRLKIDVSYYIVGRIKTTELYNANPYEVVVSAINPAWYEKPISFKIIDENTYELKLKNRTEDIIKRGFFNKEFVDSDMKITIINKTITKENASTLSLNKYEIVIHDTPTLVYNLQSALTVENPEGTNILQLKLEDVIPERAKAFLDTFASVYIENSLKTRLQVNLNTVNYIDKQMAEVTSVLKDIEDSLQSYKENRSILNLGKEEEDYFSKMSQYDERRSGLLLQLGALNSLEKYIIEDKDPQFLPPDVYLSSNDAFLKKGTNELYNLQIQENQNLTIATRENYSVEELKQRIQKLKTDLLIYINNSKLAIRQSIENIENQIEFYVSNIKTIPKKQREMLGIQRNLEVNQKMYLFLLEKKSNAIIGRAGILPQIKVIEAARNIGIVRPDKKKIELSFIVVGLILSLLFVFIRITFYTKIESIHELKRKTHYPILGEVVFSNAAENWAIAVEKDSKSPIAESFRTIRTNLQYMSLKNDSKVVVVTSNNPGEGKTFSSLNIAAILAKAGKKVLILELDLHRPKIQNALNIVADVGISTVLIGKTTIEQSIKSTRIENMYTLLSGPLPPNPSEMILSKSLEKIIEYAKENYDFTIIDTPPIGLISDALVLMKHADINLFVLNTRSTSKEIIQNTHEVVETHDIKNFGYILNGVRLKRSKYYSNKYSYGYYSYGYTDNSVS